MMSGPEVAPRRLEDNSIDKPIEENRPHRFLLLDNGMKVMLVSDDACDRAAAALNVKVGSLFDPREVQGLAHFLEHMLFLGTSKFPDEAEYSRFLQEHGGSSNAYTSDMNTCFFFNVAPDHLKGALDRFSQFFISPLFAQNCTDREMHAVDSEHKNNLRADNRRGHHLCRRLANPNHPHNHFGTGNLKTLKDDPLAAGVDIRQALLDFHQKYYSANIMSLVLLGKETLDDLEQMARDLFSGVENKNVVIPKGVDIGPKGEVPFRREDLSTVVRVVPVGDVPVVSFLFILPEQTEFWREKSTGYISHLLGHEGKGSILSQLKAEGLPTELVAGGAGTDFAGIFVFGVSVYVTEEGLTEESIQRIGELLFAYIHLLQHSPLPQWMVEEVHQLAKTKFKFLSRRPASDHVTWMADNLHYYPPDQSYAGPIVHYTFNASQVREYLNLMTVDNMRLVVASKTFDARECSEEPIYGIKYQYEPLSPTLRQSWEKQLAPTDAVAAAVHAKSMGLHLPHRNPFIPEDLSLKDRPDRCPRLPIRLEIPQDSPANGKVDLFFKQDDKFNLPKSYFNMKISSPRISTGLKERTLTTLYLYCVQEALNEYTYDATVASLSYDMRLSTDSPFPGSNDNLEISVGGFSDKLPTLLRTITMALGNPKEVLSRSKFAVAYDIIRRQLDIAATSRPPHQYVADMLGAVLEHLHATYAERLQMLRSLTYEDLLAFVVNPSELRSLPTDEESEDVAEERIAKIISDGSKPPVSVSPLFENAFIEILGQGNLTPAQALAMAADTVTSLGVASPPSKSDLTPNKCIIPTAESVYTGDEDKKIDTTTPPRLRIRDHTPDLHNPNHAASLTIVLGSLSVEDGAMAMVAHGWLHQKFFDTLRTKQQLGYLVGTTTVLQCATFSFGAQSTHPIDKVSRAIEKFVRSHFGSLVNGSKAHSAADHEGAILTAEEFDRHRKATITRLVEEPKNLAQETYRNFREVVLRRYDFDRRNSQAEYLKTVTLDDFKTFVKNRLLQAPWLMLQAVSQKASATPTSSADPNPSQTEEPVWAMPEVQWLDVDLEEWKTRKPTLPGEVMPLPSL